MKLTRFCLNPEYRRLRDELHASERQLERALATAGDKPQSANIDLQNKLQKQQQQLQAMSRMSKMRHDAAKNAISNVR